MKIILIVLGFAVVANAFTPFRSLFNKEWEAYKTKYNKEYRSPLEDLVRQMLYIVNKFDNNEHNRKYNTGEVSFFKGINKFSDRFSQEMDILRGVKDDPSKLKSNAPTYISPHMDVKYPDTVDWRESGAVTPVKNQGDCGSCWAFSSTGSLEGQHFRKDGILVSLSEQNLVDCVADDKGCKGGRMDDAFVYIRQNRGIDTEDSYPYIAKEGSCQFNKSSVGANDKGYVNIESRSEDDLLKAVATIGPISAAVRATKDWNNYAGGVYYKKHCSFIPNHGVLVVGYGTNENGEDYWIVKNSWGPDWGLDGYILMARNRDNNCGIATMALYPLV